MTHLFLISGKAQAGKDTTALILDSMADVGRVALADSLKAEAASEGWDGRKGTLGRRMLQNLGAEKRARDPQYWVKKCARSIAMGRFYPIDETERMDMILKNEAPDASRVPDVVVVTDCRFPGEIEGLKAWATKRSMPVTTVRIERPGFDNGLTDQAKEDISEIALDDYEFDYRFINVTGDPSCLRSQLDFLLRELGVRRRAFPAVSAAECDIYGLRELIGGRTAVTFDFDDCLLEKTGTMSCPTLWRALFTDHGLAPVIVTSRKEDPTEDIRGLCESWGISPVAIIYDAGNKDIISDIGPAMHFDDDIRVVSSCIDIGIPSFLVGTFASERYLNLWCSAIEDRGEAHYYEGQIENKGIGPSAFGL